MKSAKVVAALPSLLPPAAPTAAPEHRQPIIVGIGASAGGLEAMEQFLRQVPPASGCAFVIIQHLNPDHKCLLAELLQRVTSMPVAEIADGMRPEADHVYVLPPNREVALLQGVLQLRELGDAWGHRQLVDILFRSLAADQLERSLGVILSGMGSDGTLGTRAIKEQGGMVFVQTPASATFDSMPRSVIDAGHADVVALPEELPGRILAYLQRVPLVSVPPVTGPERAGIEEVLRLLRARTGRDFSLYKKNTICRRIERRVWLHQLASVTEYALYLRDNDHEVDLLFRELLIGVTRFFRDAPVWEQVRTEVIPAMLATLPEGGLLRAWVPACSTGEEAYSLAILFLEAREAQGHTGVHHGLQIFATDLDRHAIESARLGAYAPGIAQDVSEEQLRRFFVKDQRGYRVSRQIREMVIFAVQDIAVDPPFTKLDLVSCRNLLIYFEPELQRRVLSFFHYGLNPGGQLLLGNAETVGPASTLFQGLSGKAQLYRRLEAALSPDLQGFAGPPVLPRGPGTTLPSHAVECGSTAASLQVLTDRLLLKGFAPPAVLATAAGDIVYINGRTGRYLEPASGKASLNLFAMARPGLDIILGEAFPRAVRKKDRIDIKGVRVGAGDELQVVDVVIQSLEEPAALRGMVLVVFADVPPTASSDANAAIGEDVRLAALAKELQHAREETHATREEMQSAFEEYKSTVEELQSTIEELQSTNEEYATAKEEQQAVNEELQVMNQELQERIAEQARLGDDFDSLLNGTGLALLFLDAELRVRRFTERVTDLVKLIASDVGRPIADLATILDYPALTEDAREVLRSVSSRELRVPTRDGRRFAVRIMPHRGSHGSQDGVVITFTEIIADPGTTTGSAPPTGVSP